jgi:hypothetical protein
MKQQPITFSLASVLLLITLNLITQRSDGEATDWLSRSEQFSIAELRSPIISPVELASEKRLTDEVITGTQDDIRGEAVKGRYINNDYGFMVTLPKGLVGYLMPQPAIDHGFTIELSKAEKAYAWVHGTTIPMGEKTLDEVIEDQVQHLGMEKKPKIAQKTSVEVNLEIPIEDDTKPKAEGQRVEMRKLKLAAVRVLIEIDDSRSREKYTQDIVIALFKQREGFNAVYFIALQTLKAHYEKYAHVVDELTKGFKIYKMYR